MGVHARMLSELLAFQVSSLMWAVGIFAGIEASSGRVVPDDTSVRVPELHCSLSCAVEESLVPSSKCPFFPDRALGPSEPYPRPADAVLRAC